jgi:hypothetical protein
MDMHLPAAFAADPFEPLGRFAPGALPPAQGLVAAPEPAPLVAVHVAVFHGFDLLERPLVSELPGLGGLVLAAQSTVALTQAMRGCRVLIAFEGGDPGRPVVLGALQPGPSPAADAAPSPTVQAQVDGDRVLIRAEREIVLQCGEASITLTRAGKVLIQGAYVLSRSTGHHKIKGAAIDIN